TPRIIALVEEATVAALAGQLAEGQTSAGVRVQVEHISPTAVGAAVRAAATGGQWFGGVLYELPFGDAPAADFNGNGSNRDRYGIVVVRADFPLPPGSGFP
ncbi:MAG: hypothetical protein WCP53_04625, partial [Verrucomicrobiota bacterium]